MDNRVVSYGICNRIDNIYEVTLNGDEFIVVDGKVTNSTGRNPYMEALQTLAERHIAEFRRLQRKYLRESQKWGQGYLESAAEDCPELAQALRGIGFKVSK